MFNSALSIWLSIGRPKYYFIILKASYYLIPKSDFERYWTWTNKIISSLLYPVYNIVQSIFEIENKSLLMLWCVHPHVMKENMKDFCLV